MKSWKCVPIATSHHTGMDYCGMHSLPVFRAPRTPRILVRARGMCKRFGLGLAVEPGVVVEKIVLGIRGVRDNVFFEITAHSITSKKRKKLIS